MSRKGRAEKRKVIADPVYNSTLVTMLINKVLKDGKKAVAEGIVYGALDNIKDKEKTDSLKVLEKAIENVRPSLEVRSRRVGGATYQVPMQVRNDRAVTLALRWLVSYAAQRREKTMTERLTNEILDASKNLGGSIKKREDVHKMAEANKAFAHYRW